MRTRSFILGLGVSVSAMAGTGLVDFSASFSGTVNGGALAAAGTGTIDLEQQGRSGATITFSQRPITFDPLAISMVSNLCGNAFRSDKRTQNLFGLSGGNYDMTRSFQWVGLAGSSVLVQSSVVNEEGSWNSTSTVTGSYNGPTDIVGIQSYSVTWMPSSAAGEFFEAGTAVLERATGETLILQFASVFSGLVFDLEQTQFGEATFDTTFDGTTLTYGWDGEFSVPGPGGAAALVIMGFASLRRRR